MAFPLGAARARFFLRSPAFCALSRASLVFLQGETSKESPKERQSATVRAKGKAVTGSSGGNGPLVYPSRHTLSDLPYTVDPHHTGRPLPQERPGIRRRKGSVVK